jgi:hypothetical protein
LVDSLSRRSTFSSSNFLSMGGVVDMLAMITVDNEKDQNEGERLEALSLI